MTQRDRAKPPLISTHAIKERVVAAELAGLKQYEGNPCRIHPGFTTRSVNRKRCMLCLRAIAQRNYARNKGRLKAKRDARKDSLLP